MNKEIVIVQNLKQKLEVGGWLQNAEVLTAVQLIEKANERVAAAFPDVAIGVGKVEGHNFLLYIKGAALSEEAFEVPEELGKVLVYATLIDPEAKIADFESTHWMKTIPNGLLKTKLLPHPLHVSPQDTDNITGKTAPHALGGVQLSSGYACVDVICPAVSAESHQAGLPCGVVIVGASRDNALEIAAVIYKGKPSNTLSFGFGPGEQRGPGPDRSNWLR